MKIINLTCDYKTSPIDISCEHPVFSFSIKDNHEIDKQRTWLIEVATDESFNNICWNTLQQCGNGGVGIMYAGTALNSATRYYWRVTSVSANEKPLFATDFFETTLLHPQVDWHAPFISQSAPIIDGCTHAIWLRKKFVLKTKPAKARIYITAKGIYRAKINGKDVTDALLTPGFTTYHKNLLFQTYDITNMLKLGENTVLVHLGYGWYGRLGEWPGQAPYKDKPSALATQLNITFENDETLELSTDESWQWKYSRVISSSIYNGEIVAQKEKNEWFSACITDINTDFLAPHDGVLVRCKELFAPVQQITTPRKECVFDFGQNLSGFVQLKVKGKPGDIVRLRHAEVLDKDGNFYTANLRSAEQRLEYTLQTNTVEIYEPQFTFYGFRYICVDEFPGEVTAENFKVRAIYSDLPVTAQFNCSDESIMQLVQNSLWSMKSNFVDLPTDCPQRDERLGWTGDALAFCSTGAYFMQTALFFRKWMHDVRVSQYQDGALPNTVPDMFNDHTKVNIQNRNCHSAAGWGDAVLRCPYVQYVFFADKQALCDNFEMMARYIAYIKSRAKDDVLWEDDEQFGDWLALDANAGEYKGATPENYVATAFFAGANALMIQICEAIDKDAQPYKTNYEAICKAMQEKYFDACGELLIATQSACVFALQFQFSKNPDKTAAMLAKLVQEKGCHLTTGFLGTPHLCEVLFDYGYQDLAISLLHQKSYPSWLYSIDKGATTIWEHWDGIRQDETMWSTDMNSFNHYAYGSVCEFVFSRLAGLRWEDAAPGFETFTLKPYFVEQWSNCSLRYKSVRGDICVAWQRGKTAITLQIEIPSGTQATLWLSDSVKHTLPQGSYTILKEKDMYEFV